MTNLEAFLLALGFIVVVVSLEVIAIYIERKNNKE